MPPKLTAALGSVHLWWADLARNESKINRFQELLSPSERDRAGRFRTAETYRRFVAARGILRTLLGGYLAVDPAEVPLSVGDHGKPRLAGSLPPLYFNVSHADDLAVYAFAAEYEVGVDVERIQPVAEWEAIATSYFEDPEAATLATLPETQRASAFIGAWTRHEARLKVSGQGWGTRPPADFTTFSFCPIEPPAGFAASLAVAGPAVVVRDKGFL
jgi:4'-phosphopantetheinyl transferase